eukprot:2147662-Pyramimonas_sp.AAC.1
MLAFRGSCLWSEQLDLRAGLAAVSPTSPPRRPFVADRRLGLRAGLACSWSDESHYPQDSPAIVMLLP